MAVARRRYATSPQRVSRLVLISPIGLWRDDAPVQNWMSMAPEVMAKAVFYDPTGPIVAQALALPEEPEAQIDTQVQLIWTLACTGKFVWPIPDRGLKKRLHRIQSPTLIVWGNRTGSCRRSMRRNSLLALLNHALRWWIRRRMCRISSNWAASRE